MTRTLNLGCGRMAGSIKTGQLEYGLDIKLAALRSSVRHPDRFLVCGRGEQLPFRENSFDAAVVRVAFPYMRAIATLREIRRVLLPSGTSWLSFHPLGMLIRELRQAVRAGNIKNALYRCFIIANGTVFHFTGRQICLPGDRQEFFQTRLGMERALRHNGFCDVQCRRAPVEFVVTARKGVGASEQSRKRRVR
jgi:hypothetical protein